MIERDDHSDSRTRSECLIAAAWDAGMLEKYNEAIVKAAEALALDRDDWYINVSMGWFLMENGDYDEAERFSRRAVELAPERALGWETLALVFFHQYNFKEAVKYFTNAVQLEELPRTYTMMAAAKIVVGDLEGAIDDSKRALELDPQWDEAEIHLKNAQELLATK